MEYFSFLPEEITSDILCRLPSESLLECKLVCTTWRYVVSHHPSFSKMHLHRLTHAEDSGKLGFIALTSDLRNEKYHYFEYHENHESNAPIERIRRIILDPPFKVTFVVGSYNGLVCISQLPYIDAKTYICNPITKEYVILPQIKRDCDDVNGVCFYWTSGFGYVSTTNEYKVVISYQLRTQFVKVHIYTLGSGNGWRNLGKFKPQFSIPSWKQGIYVNGALYWLDTDSDTIISFDLAEEKFCEPLSLPPLPPDHYYYCKYDNRIGLLDGLLFLAVYNIEEESSYYNIWVLRKKNDNPDMKVRQEHQSLVWSKEFKVDADEYGEFGVAVTKSGGVLTYIDIHLNIYHPKTSTSKRLVEFSEKFRQVIPHMNTLVSLKELGEEETKVMKSVEMEETKRNRSKKKETEKL